MPVITWRVGSDPSHLTKRKLASIHLISDRNCPKSPRGLRTEASQAHETGRRRPLFRSCGRSRRLLQTLFGQFLTVESIKLYDAPIVNSDGEDDLGEGVIHLPETPFLWDPREQKNVYLAGHRLGWEGTGSRLDFYNLNKLKKGDSVVLRDSSGSSYDYRVSEVFVATPDADWVVQPLRGHDMLTLQTCTMPDFENRLIVRADRV